MCRNIDMKELKLKLSELNLWDENARFPDKYFNKDEKDLISYFCKNSKISDFAKEIVKDFNLLQMEKLIVYNNGENNIVYEGNRRLTVYKLLNNPNLSPNDSLKNLFIKLKKEISISDDYEFDCIIVYNPADAFPYIERKHIKGNNEINWGEQERTNHNIRRGNATQKEIFKSEIAKIIKDLDLPEEVKEKILGTGYVTNFWRIIDSSVVYEKYGISFDKENTLQINEVEEFKKHLKVIIWNVLKKEDFQGNKIDSRSLNKNTEKKKYIDSISDTDLSKVDIEIKKENVPDLFGNDSLPTEFSTNVSKVRSNPKSTQRKYLIPKTCILVINEPKINNIYKELQNDLILDDSNNSVPNAVGVLFRVFLEISLDYYANQHGNYFKPTDNINQKIKWVTDRLEKAGFDSKIFTNIKKVGSASTHASYLSIDYFHQYVHSTTTQPTSSELKLKWDNLEKFFETLWSSLKPQKKVK